jgi:hypothetical protein
MTEQELRDALAAALAREAQQLARFAALDSAADEALDWQTDYIHAVTIKGYCAEAFRDQSPAAAHVLAIVRAAVEETQAEKEIHNNKLEPFYSERRAAVRAGLADPKFTSLFGASLAAPSGLVTNQYTEEAAADSGPSESLMSS